MNLIGKGVMVQNAVILIFRIPIGRGTFHGSVTFLSALFFFFLSFPHFLHVFIIGYLYQKPGFKLLSNIIMRFIFHFKSTKTLV